MAERNFSSRCPDHLDAQRHGDARVERTVFLDRDGVINKVVFRDGRPTSPRNLAEFEIEDGVEESLKRLRDARYKLFVVTNQPDIARGLLLPESLRVMTDRILATLAIDEVRVCPHDDRDSCDCRKPKPGMLIDLAREHGIEIAESYLIGDSWKDTLAASAAGCRSIILDRPYNQSDPADSRVANLTEAVDLILDGAGK
jgi:D-glycero-D-manno-heptose 1,7-bisphosphate phosphatase